MSLLLELADLAAPALRALWRQVSGEGGNALSMRVEEGQQQLAWDVDGPTYVLMMWIFAVSISSQTFWGSVLNGRTPVQMVQSVLPALTAVQRLCPGYWFG